MARLCGIGSCSYKRTTILICCLNIIAALYVLNSLYSSVNVSTNYPANYPDGDVEYSEDQVKKMEEAIRVRKEAEPLQLVKLMNKLKKEFSREEMSVNLSKSLKVKLAEEVLQKLKSLKGNATVTEQKEALEDWRKDKLIETQELERGTPEGEARILRVALESKWDALLEYIGVWMPPEILNKEPEGASANNEDIDEQIIPGRPLPPECRAELHVDYGGAAVKWGLTHHKDSAADCCQACLDQARDAKPDQMKCNIWVYCPSETGCYSPDIYEHKHQECWLKQADKPKASFRDRYADWYRNSHPTAPLLVPWVGGVVTV